MILLPVFTQYWIDTKIPTIAAYWLACSLTAQNMLPEVLSEVWKSGLNAKMLKNAKCSLVPQHWVKTARFFFNLSTCHQTCCTCKHQTCSGASRSLSENSVCFLTGSVQGQRAQAHKVLHIAGFLLTCQHLNHWITILLFFIFYFSAFSALGLDGQETKHPSSNNKI